MSKTFPVKSSQVATSRGRGTVNRTNTNPRSSIRGANNSDSKPIGSRLQDSLRNPGPLKLNTSATASRGQSNKRRTEIQRMDQDATYDGRQPPGQTGQRTSNQTAYTMLSPNEKKRQMIAENARREAENHENYRMQNRLKHVSYVGTVGGSDVTESDARRKSAEVHRSHKYQQQQKQQKWREEKRRSEDSVYEKKKAEARKGTERNQQRTMDENKSKDEDRKRTNEAFLARIEKENKQMQAKKEVGTSSVQQRDITTGSISPSRVQNISLEPSYLQKSHGTTPDRRGASVPNYKEELCDRNEGSPRDTYTCTPENDVKDRDTYTCTPENDVKDRDTYTCTPENDVNDSYEELDQLQTMFPQYEPSFLMQILDSVDYNVEEAIILLTDD